MEDESLNSSESKFFKLIQANFLILGLAAFGIILISIGLIQMMAVEETEIKFEKGEEIGSVPAEIKIDVDGAVLKPGLYSLNSDARLMDAIEAAGGLSEEADRKAINLAAKIADGQKVYIPEIGEEEPVLGSNTISTNASGSISINSASGLELEELPGIGPVTAGKIIDARPYGSVEELRERGVVGEKTFEKIVDLISL